MTQFVAILKDSFREAVDGFVLYAMLGLSALVIVIVGSASFAPVESDKAFQSIVQRFDVHFPNKGTSRVVSASLRNDNKYAAQDVAPAGDGYKLRLVVKARSGTTTNDKHDPAGGDSFRKAVAAWAKPPGSTVKAAELAKALGGKKGEEAAQNVPNTELTFERNATPEEQRAVTDADMAEFLTVQFRMHAGTTATVTRAAGVAEPEYAFDVTAAGGSAVRGWPHKMEMFFGAVTVSEGTNLGQVLWIIEDRLINGLGAAILLLIGVIITAFFIPNMLRKGSVDLMLSKPIGRTQLLVYKYIGGLTFVFLVTAFTVGGIWLVLALRSGYWDPGFLAVIPILTFQFAIVYALSALVAVLTRSAIAAMVMSIGFMVFLYVIGQVKTLFDVFRNSARPERVPDWGYNLIDGLNNCLPRYKDLDKLTSKMIADGTLTDAERTALGLTAIEYPSWGATFGVSLAFIVLALALANWRFRTRDA